MAEAGILTVTVAGSTGVATGIIPLPERERKNLEFIKDVLILAEVTIHNIEQIAEMPDGIDSLKNSIVSEVIEYGTSILMSKAGTPGNNQEQNRQFNGAVREIERAIGRKLNKDERQDLHNAITGMNYGYHEIVEEGLGLFEEPEESDDNGDGDEPED